MLPNTHHITKSLSTYNNPPETHRNQNKDAEQVNANNPDNWGCGTHERKQLDNPPDTHRNQIENTEQVNANNLEKTGM